MIFIAHNELQNYKLTPAPSEIATLTKFNHFKFTVNCVICELCDICENWEVWKLKKEQKDCELEKPSTLKKKLKKLKIIILRLLFGLFSRF
jgi:hypothetical protein